MKIENENIRKLFRQLREDDERNAPPFARDWNAALSRLNNTPRQIWTARRVLSGIAALIILLASGGWWMFFKYSSKQDVTAEIAAPNISIHETVQQFSPPPNPVPAVSGSTSRPARLAVTRTRRKPRSRPSVRPRPTENLTENLTVKWRSPTEFLLRTSGEKLYKELPRLDESVVQIKINDSYQEK